jgi:hypothetical protein
VTAADAADADAADDDRAAVSAPTMRERRRFDRMLPLKN